VAASVAAALLGIAAVIVDLKSRTGASLPAGSIGWGRDDMACLAIVAVGLLLVTLDRRKEGRTTALSAMLSAASFGLAAVSLAGSLLARLFSSQGLESATSRLGAMPAVEALALAVISATLLETSWRRTLEATQDTPRWAPMAAMVCLSVIAAALYRAQATARRDGASAISDPLPEILLAFGLLTAILVGIVVDQILRANRRARDAECAYRDVERVIQERRRDIVELQRSQRMLRLYATELQRKNEEYDSALKAAHDAAEHKGRFIANTSHEIRTPMNGIIGMTELLLASPLDPEQRELAKTVKESADALLRILNDILDFSKVEAGQLRFETVPFDPGDTVASVVSLWTPRAVASGIKLTQYVDPEVPELVSGDPVRVRQVLTNLIGNALKFTEQGSVRVQTHVTAGSAAEVRIRFDVTDTGIGIPADKLTHIFESFTQVDDSTTRRFGGTGLGLAISKQLVEGMGGRIAVESQLDVGTRFWFEIPFRIPEPQSVAALAPGRETAHPLFQPRVLLVEDNPVNRRVALRMLEKEGCRVDAVENGELAVQALDNAAYELIFMDVQMPVMDGLQASRLIRAREGSVARTPIVALTAGALEGDRDRCLAAGMDDYMAKPISQEGVRSMVVRWTAGAKSSGGGADSVSAA
jgi:signal transduction histidine kinase/ActR/RegA family two-component response regulator